MSGELNEKILEKINKSDEDKWVKDFSKKVLRFERDNYTGKGGGYKDDYRKEAEKAHEG